MRDSGGRVPASFHPTAIICVGAIALLAGLVLSRVWTLPIEQDWVLADSGQVLNPGMWMADGAVPFRDFDHKWSPLTPLLYWATYAVLGFRESAQRAVNALALAATVAGTFAYGRRLLSAWAAAGAAALAWVLLAGFLNIGYANLYCIPLGLWAIHVSSGLPTRWRAATAGLLAGLAFALKISAGGAMLAGAWIVLLSPRPEHTLPTRKRWLDPLWPCLVAFPLLVVAVTRSANPMWLRFWFPAAAVVGLLPAAVVAARDKQSPTDSMHLKTRWGLALCFLGGALLAQLTWLPYYLQHFSPAELLEACVLGPLRWGPSQVPLPPRLPLPETCVLLGALAVAAIVSGYRTKLAVFAVTVCAVVWYVLTHARGPAPGEAWTNLTATAPWFALVALAVAGCPRRANSDDRGRFARALAVGLGTQVIVCFPWGDVGHLAYVAPYTALGIVWIAARAGRTKPEMPQLVRRLAWVPLVVPVLLVCIEAEQRSRPWRLAARSAGGWPEAVQIAPPRADVWAPRLTAEPVRQVHAVLREHPAVATDRLLSYPVSYFYWLTDTRNPLFHDHLWPGQLDAQGDAAEAERLHAHPPALVVLRADPPMTAFHLALLRRAFPALTGVLEHEYVEWRAIPPYRLLIPRANPGPEAQ